MSRKRLSAGFTLIELLVVLVIIGIVLSFATLTMDDGGLDRKAEEESRRLMALIRLLRQEGIVKNQQLAIQLFDDGYRFLRFAGGQWQPIEDDELFRPRKLPAGLRFDLDEMETTKLGEEDEEESVVLFFLSSGESTPFELHIKGDDETDYILIGDALGEMDSRNSKDKDFAEWLAESGR